MCSGTVRVQPKKTPETNTRSSYKLMRAHTRSCKLRHPCGQYCLGRGCHLISDSHQRAQKPCPPRLPNIPRPFTRFQ